MCLSQKSTLKHSPINRIQIIAAFVLNSLDQKYLKKSILNQTAQALLITDPPLTSPTTVSNKKKKKKKKKYYLFLQKEEKNLFKKRHVLGDM